ncbi:MAG: hypothetical protein JNK63_06190 [Chthonomonas sp.]|nr:hypothetical protein [Chthonomonas sp.]
MRYFLTLIAALIGLTMIGCGGGEPTVMADVPPPVLPPIEDVYADAGVPVTMVADPTFDRTKNLAATRTFGRRSDPFSLLAVERTFESRQQAERARMEYGGWFAPEFDWDSVGISGTAQPQLVVEPQPYRRLSGILLGNGVAALIEWEDGRVFEITPGSQIPGTDWVVISIDSERAILRRSGNRLPKEIIVRLGPRGSEFGGGGGGGGGGGQGGGPELQRPQM